MRFSIVTSSESTNIAIAGELDANTAGKFCQALDESAAQQRPLVEINLKQLRLIDGVGVRLLFQFYKRMRRRDCDVVLREPQGQPLAILKLLRLDRLLLDDAQPMSGAAVTAPGTILETGDDSPRRARSDLFDKPRTT
ncbi:MAG TPA: STAS domain-containing protein [Polyangia bacterium]|jgi:anti-anti-sigma factor|nr:STAS domain-containing protein [Polyangia bacterium]